MATGFISPHRIHTSETSEITEAPASPVRTNSLADAHNFEDIEPRPHPTDSELPTTIGVIQTPMTEPANRHRTFAARHHQWATTLAEVASKTAFLAATVTLTPIYYLAAPLRLFGNALAIISPEHGVAFLKTQPVRLLTGVLGRDTINQATDNTHHRRQRLAIHLGLDLVSLGLSFSAVSALYAASTVSKKVRTLSLKGLGYTDQQAQFAEQKRLDRREDRHIQATIQQAPSILEILSPYFGKARALNKETWKNYENDKKIKTQNLSSLIHENIKSFNQNNNLAARFKQNRVLPTLLAIQENRDLAEKVCEMAGLGSASCTDRASTIWMLVEETALRQQTADKILKSIADPTTHPEELNRQISKLLQQELQVFRRERVNAHTETRVPALKTQIAKYDHIELLLDMQTSVLDQEPNWFEEPPNKLFASGLPRQKLNEEAKDIIQKIKNESEVEGGPFTLLKHLETSDAWRTVFNAMHSHIAENNQKSKKKLEDAIYSVIDINLSNKTIENNLINRLSAAKKQYAGEKCNNQEISAITEDHKPIHQALLARKKELNTTALNHLLTLKKHANEFFSVLKELTDSNDPSQDEVYDEDRLNQTLEQINRAASLAPVSSANTIELLKKEIERDFNREENKPLKAALTRCFSDWAGLEAIKNILDALELAKTPNTGEFEHFTQSRIQKHLGIPT
jgi:hypothetical protein